MAKGLGRRQRQLLAMIARHRLHGFYLADLYGGRVRQADHNAYLLTYRVARRLEARGLLGIASYAYGTPRLYIYRPDKPPIGRPWDADALKTFGKRVPPPADRHPVLMCTRAED